eukprot:1141540-Pelagomonas_calceolata.AAC.2
MGVVLHLVVDEGSSVFFINRAVSPTAYMGYVKIMVTIYITVIYSIDGTASCICFCNLLEASGLSVSRLCGVFGQACLASIGCAWGVVMCWDVISSTLTGICSGIVMAKRLRYGRGLGGVSMLSVCACWVALLQWDVERGCSDGTTCVEGLLFIWEPARGGCTRLFFLGKMSYSDDVNLTRGCYEGEEFWGGGLCREKALWLRLNSSLNTFSSCFMMWSLLEWKKEKKRKVYASQRPRALREEPLTKVRGLTRSGY